MDNKRPSRRSNSDAIRRATAPYKTYACELRHQSPYVSGAGPLSKDTFASTADETYARLDGLHALQKSKGSGPELPNQTWPFRLENSRNSSTFAAADRKRDHSESQHVSREGFSSLRGAPKPRQTWVCLERTRNRSHSS